MECLKVFGELENLVGIVNTPSTDVQQKTAIIMLTAGMLHHVGPMRLHVQLARRLAGRQVPSLRYDLSGIGESLAVATPGSSTERATKEAMTAMDWLQNEYGYEKFILFGLCSGADDSLFIASNDERVVGVSLMDGCSFRTTSFYIHWFRRKYLPKILSPKKWYEMLLGGKDAIQSSSSTMPMGHDIREYPEQSVCEDMIRRLLQRGTRLQFIFTGGAIHNYSYEKQFYDMFPSIPPRPDLSVVYLPQLDHLATLRDDRELLLEHLSQWIEQTVDGIETGTDSSQAFATHMNLQPSCC